MMPLLMVYAAHAVTGGRGLFENLGRGARLSVVAFVLILSGICVSYFVSN